MCAPGKTNVSNVSIYKIKPKKQKRVLQNTSRRHAEPSQPSNSTQRARTERAPPTIYHLTIIIIIIINTTSSGAIIIIIITCPSAPSSLRQPKLVKDGRLVLVKDGLGSALPREADGRQAERPRRRERRGT